MRGARAFLAWAPRVLGLLLLGVHHLRVEGLGMEDVWSDHQEYTPRAYYLECPWKTIDSADDMLLKTGLELLWLGDQPPEYRQPLEALQAAHGFVESDEIFISAEANLGLAEAALGWGGKFSREHSHTEDEVRFALEGGVIWDIRERGPGEHWIRIHVYAGEAAIIPKDSWHRMFLLPHPTYVRMMRIYKDELGWQATYRDELPAGKEEL